MFKKKKIVPEIKEPFKIPQIIESYDGLQRHKPTFQKSVFGSAMFGSQVKDEIHIIDNSGKVDVDKSYDAFRAEGERHITDEELIAKHGTRFPEFQMVSNDTRKKVFGTTYEGKPKTQRKEETKAVETKQFSFIETKDDLLGKTKPEIRKEIPQVEEPIQEEKTPEPGLISNFKINFVVDDNVSYEYSSMDKEQKPSLVDEPIPSPPRQDTPIITPSIREEAPKPEVNSPNKDYYFKYANYQLPPISLFTRSESSFEALPAWLEEKKDIINQTLIDFDVPGEVVHYTKGPTFTRYEIMLQAGVKVNKITTIYENFQMNLGAKSIRIQAPIPGKKTIGIEVPNDSAEMVCFGDIVTSDFVGDKHQLLVALGKNIDGNSIYTRIDDMPHCLVGGATKSGKSVCINTILVSLLTKNSPEDLKLILIDPKTVELGFYEDLPHLITPVITDAKMASQSLKWAVDEMERRYKLLSSNRVRNIDDYRAKAKNNPELPNMPYIIIVIDEFADLMMICANDVEDSIQRITQKARAAGIHLILATQRPVVEFVKGSIKANIPMRIAFKVASAIDSNIILDEAGAENLLGRGDMLMKNGEIPERLQGAYISDNEINAVCDFIRAEAIPDYLFTHEDLKKNMYDTTTIGNNKESAEAEDVLYNVALYCIESGSCSINSIQQQFNFGFNRAQRVVSILEERSIVSGKAGTKGREILVDTSKLNDLFGRDD